MTAYLYLSMMPEALIVSMLPPQAFGQYYATGHSYKTRGQAIFFELDPAFRHPAFDIDGALARCTPHPDGKPKNSVYVSVYRVLEHVPVSAIGSLHLSTPYGHTLSLQRGSLGDEAPGLRLYQELAPVNSLVASSLPPEAFCASVTTAPQKFIRFPKICFVELRLGALASDPANGPIGDLPYAFLHPLREALMQLGPDKTSKMVVRVHTPDFPYRMVKGGLYVGSGDDLAFYPMPSHAELRQNHPQWWHAANL